uniref:STIL centriolar assembly protein n=1 Tax=Kryptolebias marmoratus TaxID=37003 RepID=A0A3Q3F779_KRYMA
PLSFPESRSALWDSSTAGEKLHLQLCAHRKPRVVLLEKALRLAQRHARRSNKPRLLCFFLGSASVSSDEEGVVVTLDRFDPGRDQAGTLDRVPSALLPGDVLVPCLFSVQSDPTPDPTVQSEAELHQCFKVSAFICFCLFVCLLFLTMDQTRKLVLLLESDPKAASLPLVGLWLSGVTHVYNPQVWAWCLRFMFSSALQDRVLSESGCFLLVVFGSTHRTPQFFQCRRSGPEQEPGPQLDFQLLTERDSCRHDQDSGVEDEDFSPRPSPSPHLPAPQARRIQPLVPELSLLIDSSFSSNHSPAQASDPAHRPPPPAAAPPSSASSSAPKPPPHLHSTPNSNLQQPCSCCSSHTFSCTPIFSSPTLLSAPPPSSLQSAPLHPVLPACSHQQTPPLSSRHTPPPPPSFSYQQIAPPSGSRHTPPSTNCLSTPPAPLTSSHQQTPPLSSHPTPPSSHQNALPPSTNCPSTLPAPLASLHQQTPPFSSRHCAPPPSSFSHQQTPPRSTNSPATPPVPPASIRPSDLQNSPPLSTLSPSTFLLPPAPACPCSHTAPPPLPHPCWSDSPSPAVADPVSPSWLPCPSCRCSKTGGVAPSDTYRLLLHQDRQLRLLQAQVTELQTQETAAGGVGCVCGGGTLATINPAAVVSRLTVSEGTGSALFPGGSVDLSLEANAIALRYLSDSQLSRLSLGGHAPQNIPAPSSSSGDSLMSPSNMSLATRKYMRRYGLIEEDDGEEEEREEVLEARRPLTNAQNLKLLPQSQLIQELRPKMQLLAGDKENRSSRRPPEASVGNLLDLRRLRQLPKLF